MENGERELLPERLREVRIPLSFASRVTGRPMPGLWRAVKEGRLKATPYPAGARQVHWQVKLGDLVDYTGTPVSEKWLAVVEACLAWQPGREIQRVA